jgi:hypothetical protein
MDPLSQPPEILHAQQQTSKETLDEWRRGVSDTNSTLSGWSRAHFDFSSQHGTNRYYLHVERYRDESTLKQQFAGLLARNPARQTLIPRGIGDTAAVVYEPGVVTLWFRRGQFRVSVASFGGTPAGEQEGSLRHLATAVDARIQAGAGTTKPEHKP